MFLCLAATARAQADYEYRYWFDTAHGETRTGRSVTKAWHMEVPTDGLSLGMHTLHVQVKDTAQAWSAPVSRTFLKTSGPTGLACRYWFDADKGEHGTASAWGGGAFPLDVAGLDDGMHSVHFQLEDAEKSAPSVPVTSTFLKTSGGAGLVCRYWFDNDKSEPLVVPTWGQGAFPVDVSHLDDGIHSVHFQVDGKGAPTLPTTNLFLKIPPTEGVDYMLCVADIDEKPFRQERVPASGGVVNWSLDATALAPGLHRMQVRVVTPTGAVSSVSDHFFFRTTTSQEMAAMKCYYSIDGETVLSQAGTYGKGLFHFDVDVAGLEDGLHRIAYFLSSETGGSTRLNAAWFVKTPLGGNGIARYDYWLNEQTETAHRVELSARRNPFDLVSLLPVESVPVRSSSFQFELEDGHPVLYARNDLHVRFYDAAGRFTDMTRSFADYKVSRRVEDIYPLVSGQQVSKPCPAENGILWYRLDAATGDSLSFRTTQAASVQLFSPSGREVYSASGAASVAFGGCHAWEDGTYYLAVHDVTGTRSTTIGVDYVHIDKYAVLHHTPTSVGVSPTGFTIQLQGNGYDKLQSAALLAKGADTATVVADTLYAQDKSEAYLRFNLTGEERYGNYSLLLTFQDSTAVEELLVEDALSLVRPMYGDIDITVKDIAKLAMPYPITIKVKNTGNVPYLMLPLNIAYDNVDNVSDFALENFSVIMEKENVDSGLKLDVTTDNLLGKGVKGRMFNFMIPEIGPEEEIELTVSFVAAGHTRFNLYAWTDTPWSLSTKQVAANASFAKARRTIQSTDCMPDPCEVISGIVGDMEECSCGLIMANIDALSNLYLAMIRRANLEAIRAAGYNSYQEMKEALGVEMDMFERLRLRNPNDILLQLISHCGPERLTAAVAALMDLRNQQATDDCPRPEPHPIEILVPGDPNDMLGYTAESGSKCIAEGVQDVFYTIEFENDPELASASAHTIVVTDTLDAARFDLSSFEPTGVKIGHVYMECDGSKSFVRTMDLRPAINVIAEVTLDYNESKGIAVWTIHSLDPMSMEPSDNPMEGALPINADGNGQGEVTFNIKLKKQFDDGVTIDNRASIVFDREAPILTPTWINVVDTVAPVSALTGGVVKNDSILTLTWRGEDNRSGLWRYDLYVQDGAGASWRKAVENVTDTLCDFRYYEGMNYGFCVVATDSAGNVERKELAREFTLESFKPGDANGDGKVDALDVTLVVQYYLTKRTPLNLEAADVVRDGVIDALDITRIQQIHLKGNSRIKKRMRRRMYETK